MAEDDFYERLKKTWPAKAIQGILSGVTAPGDAWAGRLDPLSEEGIARTNELAGVAMTGGLPIKTPGVSLASGLTRPPKMTGGYHATAYPEEFSKFKNMGMDVGTSITTSPNVAVQHSLHYPSTFPSPDAIAGPRTMPVVADIQKPFKYPRDPMDWTEPELVINPIRAGVEMGFPFPKGVLSGMESAAKQTGGLKENLIPMMKEKGYDSIKFPHDPGDPRVAQRRFNSYMAFDPKQVTPRFSPEGQALIKERGIIEPPKNLLYDDITRTWIGAPEQFKARVQEYLKYGTDELKNYPKADQEKILDFVARMGK